MNGGACTRARLIEPDPCHAIALNSCYVDRKELINVSYNYMHAAARSRSMTRPAVLVLFFFHIYFSFITGWLITAPREQWLIDLHKSDTDRELTRSCIYLNFWKSSSYAIIIRTEDPSSCVELMLLAKLSNFQIHTFTKIIEEHGV